MENEKKENSFMMKLSTLIVDKRKGFYLVFIVLIIFSVISMNKVKVNNDLTTYLPDTTETRQGITLMDEQFITYGTARVMVCNVTFDEAQELADHIEGMEGVSMLDFDDTDEYYHDMEALYAITFDGEKNDEIVQEYLTSVLDFLSEYDVYYTSDIGQEERDADDLNGDMIVILILAAVVIVAVLLFTSTTYAEIPVYIMTFCTAAILNKGTNYLFGTISFVTNSIAVVLQLALALDYAIILAHRFMEEHEDKDAREAVIVALSKAIPEISSSSLTTVSGMIAMMFMQFRIGYDMGIILAKAIVLSLVSVFLLMPGLLLTFSKAIDATHHKSFVPKITAVGKFCVYTRYIMPPLLVIAVILAFFLSNRAYYVYDVSTLKSNIMSANKFSASMVNQEFGTINQLAVLVPNGDYEREAKALGELKNMPEVDSCMGLANIEAMDGYILTQSLSPREFAELIDLDVEVARLLYSAYAVDDSDYGALVNGVSEYKVPLIDMFLFIYNQKESGNITLDDELEERLTDAYSQITIAKNQLLGEAYSRFVLELNVPVEGEETYAALEKIRNTVAKYYPLESIYLVGNSTSDKDLSAAFGTDNVIITVLTALFVMIILLFTFQSAGLPVLLVVTIQGSIWMNFSLPYLLNEQVYFLGYLVVSAIQMGATIDYAIVITSRYMDLKTYMPIKEAIVETLNQAFPTIVTSGSVLVAAGFIISNVSTNAVVAAIGLALGRGTLTSIALVLLVLPQTLLIGDIIIEKTAFNLKYDLAKPLPASGRIRMHGHIRGYVNGVIEGEFSGVIEGEMGAVVRPKDKVEAIDDKESGVVSSPKLLETLGMVVLCSLALMGGSLAKPMQVQAAESVTYEDYRAGRSGMEGVGDAALEQSQYTVIEIFTEEELADLAEKCRLDTWSRDKYVKLMNDIVLTEHADINIPSFGGIFDGGSHKISGLNIMQNGSEMSLFRYVQESGIVRNLTVKGKVMPEGSQSRVGGIVGVNYGKIFDCSFFGQVIGDGEVGGIAGVNEENGEIRRCDFQGIVLANHSTGGIAGNNKGTLNNCKNKGSINTHGTEVSYELEDLTVENLEDINSTYNISAHTDTGGIAGISEGKIYYCVNEGTVGYMHVGYNVGGIVGRLHQGYFQSCTNTGHVYGRKDVGGIVGQMEPFMEIEYLGDKLQELDRETELFLDLLSDAQGDLHNYSQQASSIAQSLNDSLRNANAAGGDLLGTVNTLWCIYNQELNGIGNDLKSLNGDLSDQKEADEESGNVHDVVIGGNHEQGDENAEGNDNAEGSSTGEGDAATEGGIKDTEKQNVRNAVRSRDIKADAVRALAVNTNVSESGSVRTSGGFIKTGAVRTSAVEQASGEAGSETGSDTPVQDSQNTPGTDEKPQNISDESSVGTDRNESGVSTGESAPAASDMPVQDNQNTLGTDEKPQDISDESSVGTDTNESGAATGESNKLPITDIVPEPGKEITVQIPNDMESYKSALKRFSESAGGHLSNMATESADRSGGITDNLNILNAEMKAAGDSLGQLADILEESTDKTDGDVNALVDQARVLRNLINEIRDDLFRYEGISIEDASDEGFYDTDSFKQGKITLCVNKGKVEADTNVGGIAGQISTEYDFDPEDDIEVTGAESFNVERSIKAVIRDSRNEGEIIGKKDYAGGIVGRAEHGAIISCESYGDVGSTNGSYVGGVAGASSYAIRGCYSMGSLSGKNYVGGIVGKGSDIFYSYAYNLFDATGECVGSIAGQIEKDGTLYDNYYVAGDIGGIDGIGYQGGATPLPYEEFSRMENVPEEFSRFTIIFMAEGQELASYKCGYGEAVPRSEIPQIPEKEGYYGVWPEFDFSCITRNKVLEVQYVKWISSLKSAQVNENGKPILLVEGNFLPGYELTVESTENKNDTDVTFAIVKQDDDGTNKENYTKPVQVRIFCENPKKMTVFTQDGTGAYVKTETEVMGSYLRFTMEQPGTFRLTKEQNYSTLIGVVVGICVVLIVVAAVICIKKGKKRKAAQTEREEIESNHL
ncbi:MAG: MMPL family transporter [Bacteroidales bacterium]|nr:MMPL family transporter [Lachnoclostridium sp.]MCM1385539.1 MMPL family transporter [Lachnoclostridium sp.]MCM1465485.1 MMPL family transporter [Bacteroidales bacterium]